MAGGTKLHEILAVEGSLDATQRKLVDEARDTFGKKPDHFIGAHRSLEMFAENDKQQNAEEHKAMVTTVHDKLGYVAQHVAKYLDVVATKEHGNQVAKADLVVDGVVVAKDLPATLLLSLESKLGALREMYLQIPTLAPGRQWTHDPSQGAHVYKDAHPDVKMKTQKTVRHKVLVEPTEHHPAQIEKWMEDVPVGKIVGTTWSGMVSPAEKSDLLERLDTLMRAVKKARMRANGTEIKQIKLGKRLFDYVHTGLAPAPAGDASP